jgi:hypothetical protein
MIPGNDSREERRDLAVQIISMIPKDAIPTILDPQFTPAWSVES